MFENFKKKLRVLKILKPYVWMKEGNIRLRVIGSTLLTLVTAALSITAPLLLKKSIEMIAPEEETEDVWGIKFGPISMLIAYGSIWTLAQITGYSRAILISKIVSHTNRELTRKTIQHLSALSLPFREAHSTGTAIEALSKAQSGAGSLIQNGLVNIAPSVLEISLASGIIARFYGIQYGLGTVGMLTAYAAFTLKSSAWSDKALQASNRASGEASSRITDTFLNYDTVEYFNNAAFEVAQCDELLRKKAALSVDSDIMGNVVLLGQSVILGLGLTLITAFHGKETLAGTYQVSDFILLNNYLFQFVWPLNALGFSLRDIRGAFADLTVLMEILEMKPVVTEDSNAKYPMITDSSVIFDDVSFTYPNGKKALENISFVAPAGKKTAIVGESGSGKTTIGRLLFRFYNVDAGNIMIGSEKISKMRIEFLRSLISIIPQETGIFNQSLGYNLHYGNLLASENAVEAAVNDSQLKPIFYRDSCSYTSLVGEKGVKLSGGEKQRIGICRALLKEPKIYLLDEMTSSLDATTEQSILKNVDRVTRGSTVLTITHRLSAAKNADQIFVMKKGKIIQRGTHESLLREEKGAYLKMWNDQASQEDEPLLNSQPVLLKKQQAASDEPFAAEVKERSREDIFSLEDVKAPRSSAAFFPIHADENLPSAIQYQEEHASYHLLEDAPKKKRCVIM